MLARLACRAVFLVVFPFALCAQPAEVHMLVPGFRAQELPLSLPNINNLRFDNKGRLFALAYDGHIYVLRDTNGDGLEDDAKLFWDEDTISVPVGMVVADDGVYVSSHGKVCRLRDDNHDGKADREEIIANGWPPTDVASGGVDATAVTLGRNGDLYFGLIAADYSNPYRVKDGVSRYDLHGPRGTIQRLRRGATASETIATGIRVPYALAFNRDGDLFCTDQEGETWCPNGNPLDELNHIIAGRNYGFPPPDDKWLPGLHSEPPVVAFGPQHQSSCGLIFNEPHKGQGLFGPKWWNGDALVAGESRGKIWRVRLVKTKNGYIGKEFTIARLSMLTMDLAISPAGALYVCCHSGQPDWGTGPKGKGKIFKITYVDTKAPQPVWAAVTDSTELRIAFDKPLDSSVTNELPGQKIEFGDYVRAGDRFEVLKPPYKVVQTQEHTPRGKLNVVAARLVDQNTLALTTDPHPLPVAYALTVPGVKAPRQGGAGAEVDVDYDLSGVLPEKNELELIAGLPGAKKLAASFASAPPLFPPPAKKYPYIHSPEPTEGSEFTGGDFEQGKALFFGDKLKCSTCHRLRGEGSTVGPDLSNLASRDASSVLHDIKEPSASIHPDYVAYNVSLKQGEVLTGFLRSQDEHSLRLSTADGKETRVDRGEVTRLVPSSVSLMPAGLLEGVKPDEIEALLTFLVNAPPERRPAEIKLALQPNPATVSPKSLHIALVASEQDHGPGQHDYPRWQKTWHALLSKASNVQVENAWQWPSVEQFEQADVLVFYYWNRDWNETKLQQIDAFLSKGKGLVLLHSATIGNPVVDGWAERIGFASDSAKTKYIHTPIDLKIVAPTNHPIFVGVPRRLHFIDEPYWPMIGSDNRIQVLATAERDKQDWPIMWTLQKENGSAGGSRSESDVGGGRVFASIFGHYTWTLNDPWFRLIILRAIGWVAGEDPNRLESLALITD
jgi:putative heme-binding domain-containing protein